VRQRVPKYAWRFVQINSQQRLKLPSKILVAILDKAIKVVKAKGVNKLKMSASVSMRPLSQRPNVS
jgi:hypothetical protein